MAKLKLTYFDFDGGRGEPARLALHIAGIAFEDHRIAGQDWPAFRDRTPFLAMPILEVDGQRITQSNSINRYIGKLAGLYQTQGTYARAEPLLVRALEIREKALRPTHPDVAQSLNNLAGLAWTKKEIRMTSDGTPWRPIVHGLDIAQAILAVTIDAFLHVKIVAYLSRVRLGLHWVHQVRSLCGRLPLLDDFSIFRDHGRRRAGRKRIGFRCKRRFGLCHGHCDVPSFLLSFSIRAAL